MIKIKNRIVTSLLTVVFILSILILSLMPVLYVEAQTAIDNTSTLNIKFEPSGTHIDSKGNLKIRLDFYPTPDSKSYDQYHVYIVDTASKEYLAGYQGKADAQGNPIDPVAYQKWLDGLPHIWQTNPCLCAFVTVSSDVTKETLDQYVKNTYTDTVTATIDDCMIQANSSHLISPYMKDKVSVFSTKEAEETAKSANLTKTELQKVALSESVNTSLKDYAVTAKAASGLIEKVEPKSIDVGSAATDRGSSQIIWNRTGLTPNTAIDYNNAANATGSIDTVEAWFAYSGASDNVRFGSFADGGSAVFTCRDGEAVGDVTAGSKQTYTGLAISISSGDFIGTDTTTGGNFTNTSIEKDTSGYSGIYTVSGQSYCDPTDSDTFTIAAGDALSLYGTGTESVSVGATNTPSTKDYGILDTSATSSTAINFFEIENTGSGAIDIEISGTDLTGGGDTWTLSNTATPGENTYGLKAGLDDADDTFDIIVKKTASYNVLVENLAESGTQSWGLQILMPTSVTNYEGQQMSGTITLIVSAH